MSGPPSGRKTNAPSQGEKNAITGFEPQYALAAELALRAAKEGHLRAVRLIDPVADIVDDFQIVRDGRIDAYQVKWGSEPSAFTFAELKGLVRGLARGRAAICKDSPSTCVVVHVVTNGSLSTNDSIKDSIGGKIGTFFAFCRDILHVTRSGNSISIESQTKWRDALAELRTITGLKQKDFDDFLHNLHVDSGQILISDRHDCFSSGASSDLSDVERVKAYLLRRVRESDGHKCVEIIAQELLTGAGIGDRLDLRNRHEFPPSRIDYRPLFVTRGELRHCLQSLPGGYVSLIGSPGSGKSTLINEEFADSGLRVIRYYAFVPGQDLSGSLRGESDHFLHDLCVQLVRLGSSGGQRSARMQTDKRQVLFDHFVWLQTDFKKTGRKTVFFIDGLDHIPREQKPIRSLLLDLPLPSQIPDGVFFVLGSQTTDLSDFPIEVRSEISKPDRRIQMSRLNLHQVEEIASAEFPGQVSPQISNRLFEISEGHPLTLAILVNICQQPPSAITTSEVIDRLRAIDFVGTDIEAYYDRLWEGAGVGDGLFYFMGRVCRDRLPFDAALAEAELGRETAKKMLTTFGHLWQRDPRQHFQVYHNSFRLFLRRKTSTDVLGNYDESRHLRFHCELAKWYLQSTNPLDKWESLFHLCESNQSREAIGVVTLGFVREQIRHFRNPDSLYADLRLLMLAAIEDRNLPKVAELALAINDVGLCESSIGTEYDAIFMELIQAGHVMPTLRIVMDGPLTRLGTASCMKVAVKLLEMGFHRAAHLMFQAGEPCFLLHQLPAHQREAVEELLEWARTAPRFRRPEQVLQMIREAALQSSESVFSSVSDHQGQSETVRNRLLVAFGSGLPTAPSSLLEELDQEIRGRCRSSWLSLRVTRIKEMLAGSQARRRLADDILSEYTEAVPSDLPTWERLLVAEIALSVCSDPACARRMIDTVPPPRVFDFDTYNGLSQSQHHWFRFVRLRIQLGDSSSILNEVNFDSDHDFRRTIGILTKHIARLGMLSAQRKQGILPTPALVGEIRTILRFMSQHSNETGSDNDLHRIRTLRPSVMDLVLTNIADADSRDDLISLFVSSLSGEIGTIAWTITERVKALHLLIDFGASDAICRKVLSDIERDWPADEPDASSRSDRELQLAKAKNRLKDHNGATAHLQTLVASQGTVDHRKDNQQETWCRFIEIANKCDKDDERRLRRTELVIRSAVAVASTDAHSRGAAEAAIADSTRWNPAEGMALVRHMSESSAISFTAAAMQFIETSVIEHKACSELAPAIFSRFLLPLDEPSPTLLTTIVDSNTDTNFLESLAEQANVYARPQDRLQWHRCIVEESRRKGIIAPKPSVDAVAESVAVEIPVSKGEDKIELVDDREVSVQEAFEQVDTPEAYRRLRAECSESRWNTTHKLTTALCNRWGHSFVVGLSEVVTEYDRVGREVMVCAERLEELGDSERAIGLAKLVLSHGGDEYGDDWQGNGLLLRAVKILERYLDRDELREVVFASLKRYLSSDHHLSASGTELFTEVFPRICRNDEILAIAESVEGFLNHATRHTPSDTSWHRPAGTAREALIGFVADRLGDPVNYLAESARQCIIDWLSKGNLHESDLQFLCRRIEGDTRAVRGFLAALCAVASDAAVTIRPITVWLRLISRSCNFGLRTEVGFVLKLIGEAPLEGIPTDAALMSLFVADPLIGPHEISEESVKSTGFLRDTFDAERMTALFKGEIELLATVAGVKSSKVVRRVYDIAVSVGRESWSENAERDLRHRLDLSSLHLTFQRPRTVAIEEAIHRAASELSNAGRITADEGRKLLPLIRATDPVLLRVSTSPRPSGFPKCEIPDYYTSSDREWIEVCQDNRSELRQCICRKINDWVVLAEHSTFRMGRGRYEETRVSNLWFGGHEPDVDDRVLPLDCVAYATQYFQAKCREMAIAVRHFPRMEHHGSHSEWVSLNAAAAAEFGFEPDSSRLFGWTNGNDIIWVLRWSDGHPLVCHRDGKQSDGWLLLGSEGVAAVITARFQEISRICHVRRTKDRNSEPEEANAFWHEPFDH